MVAVAVALWWGLALKLRFVEAGLGILMVMGMLSWGCGHQGALMGMFSWGCCHRDVIMGMLSDPFPGYATQIPHRSRSRRWLGAQPGSADHPL